MSVAAPPDAPAADLAKLNSRPDAPGVSAPEEVHVVLAKVVARVDALTAATTTFRNLVGDRVSEYTERVVAVAASTTAELEDQQRLREREMAELRSGVTRANSSIDRIAASVDGLAIEVQRVADDLATQLALVADEVQTLRRRTAVRPRGSGRSEEADDDGPPRTRRPPRKRT